MSAIHRRTDAGAAPRPDASASAARTPSSPTPRTAAGAEASPCPRTGADAIRRGRGRVDKSRTVSAPSGSLASAIPWSPRVAVHPGVDGGTGGGRVEVVGHRRQHGGHDRARRGAGMQAEGPPPLGQGVDGLPELGVAPLPVAAVVVAQQRQPDRHRVDLAVAQLGDEDEVAARLRHLLAVEADHPGVRVDLRERPPGRHLRLVGAHLVVGEDQVASRRPARRRSCRAGPGRSRRTRCASRDGRGPKGLSQAARRAARRATRQQSRGSFLPSRSGSPPRSGKIVSISSRVSPDSSPNAGSRSPRSRGRPRPGRPRRRPAGA